MWGAEGEGKESFATGNGNQGQVANLSVDSVSFWRIKSQDSATKPNRNQIDKESSHQINQVNHVPASKLAWFLLSTH